MTTEDESFPVPTKLVDMYIQLEEIESLVKDVQPREIPIPMYKKYISIRECIEKREKELLKHVRHLVDSKFMGEKEASPFIGLFDVTSKRKYIENSPIFSLLEASLLDHNHLETSCHNSSVTVKQERAYK